MDVALKTVDEYIFTPYVYPTNWSEDWWARQFLTLFVVVNLGAYLMYFSLSTLSYYTTFDHSLMRDKKFLENQVLKEIIVTCKSIPLMSIPTNALFLAEIRGSSKLYTNIEDHGWLYFIASIGAFLFFTDMMIYFIHRGLHHPSIYRHFHKTHHRWIIPSPFASHAFHPIDGFLQSSPYHLFVFLFPLQKWLYIGLFVFVNIWTVSIHDGNYKVPKALQPIVNGSAHHTDHHLFFNYNYGQFFTLWDRIGKSFRNPPIYQNHQPDQKPTLSMKSK